MTAAVLPLHTAPSPEQLEAELAQLSARIDAATHRQLTLIRAIDEREIWAAQGARSCAAWLGFRIGLSAGSARERVRVARALADLPLTDAAMAEGRVSFSKARALTRVATPDNEGELLAMALASTAAQLERICSGLKRARSADSEANSEDAEDVSVERFVHLRAMADGSREVRARLHADEAALVMEVLHRGRAGLAQECGAGACSEAKDAAPNLADAWCTWSPTCSGTWRRRSTMAAASPRRRFAGSLAIARCAARWTSQPPILVAASTWGDGLGASLQPFAAR